MAKTQILKPNSLTSNSNQYIITLLDYTHFRRSHKAIQNAKRHLIERYLKTCKGTSAAVVIRYRLQFFLLTINSFVLMQKLGREGLSYFRVKTFCFTIISFC